MLVEDGGTIDKNNRKQMKKIQKNLGLNGLIKFTRTRVSKKEKRSSKKKVCFELLIGVL